MMIDQWVAKIQTQKISLEVPYAMVVDVEKEFGVYRVGHTRVDCWTRNETYDESDDFDDWEVFDPTWVKIEEFPDGCLTWKKLRPLTTEEFITVALSTIVAQAQTIRESSDARKIGEAIISVMEHRMIGVTR